MLLLFDRGDPEFLREQGSENQFLFLTTGFWIICAFGVVRVPEPLDAGLGGLLRGRPAAGLAAAATDRPGLESPFGLLPDREPPEVAEK